MLSVLALVVCLASAYRAVLMLVFFGSPYIGGRGATLAGSRAHVYPTPALTQGRNEFFRFLFRIWVLSVCPDSEALRGVETTIWV